MPLYVMIIVFSFMCCFSKLEHITHYKAKNKTMKTDFNKHLHMHSHPHTLMHALTHIQTHTHTHTYTHTHTHTHTHARAHTASIG